MEEKYNLNNVIPPHPSLLIFDLCFRKPNLHLLVAGFDPFNSLYTWPNSKIWCSKSMILAAWSDSNPPLHIISPQQSLYSDVSKNTGKAGWHLLISGGKYNQGIVIPPHPSLLICDLCFRKPTLHLFMAGFHPLISLSTCPPSKIWCNKSMTLTA